MLFIVVHVCHNLLVLLDDVFKVRYLRCLRRQQAKVPCINKVLMLLQELRVESCWLQQNLTDLSLDVLLQLVLVSRCFAIAAVLLGLFLGLRLFLVLGRIDSPYLDFDVGHRLKLQEDEVFGELPLIIGENRENLGVISMAKAVAQLWLGVNLGVDHCQQAVWLVVLGIIADVLEVQLQRAQVVLHVHLEELEGALDYIDESELLWVEGSLDAFMLDAAGDYHSGGKLQCLQCFQVLIDLG